MVLVPTGDTDPHLTVGAEQIRRQLVLIANADILLHPLFGRQRAELVLREDLPEPVDLLETIPAQGDVTLLAVVARADHVTLVTFLVLFFLDNDRHYVSRGRRVSRAHRWRQTGNLMLSLIHQPQHLVAVLQLLVYAALLVQNGTDVADAANGRLARTVHHVYDAPFAHQMVAFQDESPAR